MKHYPRNVSHPDGELQYGVETWRGEVEEWVAQLYCWTDDGRHLVAQSDHNPHMPMGHDVTAEGIHLDIFGPDGEKVERLSGPLKGPMAPEVALNYAKDYLTHRNEQIIQRYKAWANE
jgi:hypothetical protein